MSLGIRTLGSIALAFFLLLPLVRAAGPPSGLAERVRSYNDRLTGARGNTRALAQAGDALTLLRARAADFQALIEADPSQALALTLPAETRRRFASLPGAADHIESDGAWTGLAQSLVEDDFETGRARTLHRLETGAETLDLHFASAPPKTNCAQTLEVQGVRMGNAVAAATAVVQPAAAPTAVAGTCTSAFGDRRVAVLLLSLPGTPLPAAITPALVQNAFFGAGRSLDGFWREASYGQASASGSVFGPFVLNADYPCSDTTNIMKAALNAAQGSVNFRDYTHIYFIHPKNGSCSSGTGSVGCWRSSSPQGTLTTGFVWLPVSASAGQEMLTAVAVHEGGHNLGLEHSATIDYGAETLGPPGATGVFDEYGDRFSAMGATWSVGSTVGYGHYAAQQKVQLGWLQDNANVRTVETSDTFLIYPYETPAGGPQALRVRRGTGGASWLWLEYRQPAGNYDPQLAAFGRSIFGGALIRFEDPSDTAHQGYTKLLNFNAATLPGNFSSAALPAGRTWTDNYSDLSIRVDSATADALAVTVSYGGPGPQPQLASSAVSAADGSTEVAPGSIVSLYGAGLAAGIQHADTIPLPVSLGGTSVEIVDGSAVSLCPLFFVSPEQINAQLPYDVSPSAQVRVRTAGGITTEFDLRLQPATPRLFTWDMNGAGNVAALHWPDYSVVDTASPASPGDILMLYMTGLGSVTPAVAAGTAARDGADLSTCDLPVRVIISGQEAEVLWAGLAPGFSGLYQVNVKVPPLGVSGARSILVQAGTAFSQSGATLPIQP